MHYEKLIYLIRKYFNPKHQSLMNIIKLITIAFALATIPTTGSTQAKDSALPDNFYSGSLLLEYSMFGKGASGAKLLKKLHDDENWIDLARSVIDQKSQGYDIYYYYLSVSAMKLGHETAAKSFAEKALGSNNKCDDGFLYDLCQGINVKRNVSALLGTNKLAMPFPPLEIIEEFQKANKIPLGVGEIKLGEPIKSVLKNDASRSAWVRSSESRGAMLNSDIEVPGAEFFNVVIVSPLSSAPLKGDLTFGEGRLIKINVDLGEGDISTARLQTIKDQILNRYGNPAKSLEEITEVRCIFGSANSYTIKNGSNSYSWTQPLSGGWYLVAELNDIAVGVCPRKSTESRVEHRKATYVVSIKIGSTTTEKSLF